MVWVNWKNSLALLKSSCGRALYQKAILLSGGGNDVAGDEFGLLLDHAQSPLPGFNDQVVSGIIDQRVKIAYVTILSAVTQICEERLNRKLPILVHGYDYPVADRARLWRVDGGFCPALGWNQASAKKVSAT
jgi:hypothetical protein